MDTLEIDSDVIFPGLHSQSICLLYLFPITDFINRAMSLRLSTRHFCRPYYRPVFFATSNRSAQFSHAAVIRQEKVEDPRLKEEVGDLIIEDQYAILREKYGT
jgi:hypothetical protein